MSFHGDPGQYRDLIAVMQKSTCPRLVFKEALYFILAAFDTLRLFYCGSQH